MRVMLLMILCPLVWASDFKLNFYHSMGVSQGFEAETLFALPDMKKRTRAAYRRGVYFFLDNTIEENCSLAEKGSTTVFETPDSFVVDVSLNKKFISKILSQGKWPVHSKKNVKIYSCGKTEVYDFSVFNFNPNRELAATLILEFTTSAGRAFVFPKEFGGLDRFYAWEKQNHADLSIVVGSAEKEFEAKDMIAHGSFLIPMSRTVKQAKHLLPRLLVSNFEKMKQHRHYSFVKSNKGSKRYGIIGISEILDRAESVSSFDLKNNLEELLEKLRDQCDLIIVAGIMNQATKGVLQRIKGIDLIVTTEDNYELTTRGDKEIFLTGRKGVYIHKAVQTVGIDLESATQLTIRDLGKNKFKVSITNQILDDRMMAKSNGFKNFWITDERQQRVLPPRKTLRPVGVHYQVKEVAQIFANALQLGTGDEVAISYPYKMRSVTMGAISSTVFRLWSPKTEQWIRGRIKGEELATLNRSHYVLGGLAQNRVAGVPLDDNFFYDVVLPISRREDFKTFISAGQKPIDGVTLVLKTLIENEPSLIQKFMSPCEGDSRIQLGFYVDKAAVEFSTLSRHNGDAFSNVSNSDVSTPSNTLLGIDLAAKIRLDYRRSTSEFGWSALYKSSHIEEGSSSQVNVLDDDYKIWLSQGFPWVDIDYLRLGRTGPFAQILYDSEFSPSGLREKIFNGQIGWKLFEGKYLSELSFAPFWESDLSDERAQYGFQGHLKAKYKMDYGRFMTEVSLKYYFDSDDDLDRDLKHLGKFEISYENKLFGRFSLAPFFRFLHYKNRLTREVGHQTLVGVKLNFVDSWRF